jgi:drug/metabolite transporter (DMT)-like permease
MTGAGAGIVLMVAGDLGRGEMLGNLFALAIALAGGLNAVVLRGARDANMMPAVILGGALCALATLPFATPLAAAPRDFWLLLALGAIQLALPTTLYVFGARYLAAAELTLVALLEAVLAPFWVWLFMNETPSPHTLGGGALVLTSILALMLAAARRRWAVPAGGSPSPAQGEELRFQETYPSPVKVRDCGSILPEKR